MSSHDFPTVSTIYQRWPNYLCYLGIVSFDYPLNDLILITWQNKQIIYCCYFLASLLFKNNFSMFKKLIYRCVLSLCNVLYNRKEKSPPENMIKTEVKTTSLKIHNHSFSCIKSLYYLKCLPPVFEIFAMHSNLFLKSIKMLLFLLNMKIK